MFLVKKFAVGAAGVALVSTLCFGRDAMSYIGTSIGLMKDSVKNSVPMDFEINRARDLVKNLAPEVRKNMHVIAQEEVEVERLERQIASSQGTVDKERGELVRLKNDLSTKAVSFEYNGRNYSAQQVKQDLANRFERFKTHEATLASLRDIQSARRRSLDAARQKLDGMLAAKRQLEVDVENLEARLKMVEVAQTASNYKFDESQLGRVRELLGELRGRLSVAEKLVCADGALQDEIQLATPSTDNIVDQVTEYLAPSDTTIATSEAKDAK